MSRCKGDNEIPAGSPVSMDSYCDNNGVGTCTLGLLTGRCGAPGTSTGVSQAVLGVTNICWSSARAVAVAAALTLPPIPGPKSSVRVGVVAIGAVGSGGAAGGWAVADGSTCIANGAWAVVSSVGVSGGMPVVGCRMTPVEEVVVSVLGTVSWLVASCGVTSDVAWSTLA